MASTSTVVTATVSSSPVVTLTSTPPTTEVVHGPRNDAADFYGLLLALVVIVASIAAVRVFFRRR